MATPSPAPAKKVNYLNNRDILKEIHLSKNTYCTYLDPVKDHQYDIILPTVEKINQRTVAEARRNRADRIKRETGVVTDPKKIPNTDLVFRITTWEHIPMAPPKPPKSANKSSKIKKLLEEIDSDTDDFGGDTEDDTDSDDVMDMTGASDAEVIKVFRAMKPEDGIVVKKDGNKVEFQAGDDDYIIKLDENEESSDETLYEIDLDEELGLEDDTDES